MFRIDSQGAVPSLPGPEPAGSTAGYFFKGNPAVGQKATVVSADWANEMNSKPINIAKINAVTFFIIPPFYPLKRLFCWK